MAHKHTVECDFVHNIGAKPARPYVHQSTGGPPAGQDAQTSKGPPQVPKWQLGDATAFLATQAQLHDGKYNEASHITLEALPTVTKYRTWKNHLRKEVAGASGRPHKAFALICEVD